MTEEEMFLSNEKLIYLAIKDLNLYQYDLDDLKQMGGIGLIKAIRGFDESKGFKFSTYAVKTIRVTILHQLRNGQPVRVSPHTRDLAFKIKGKEWIEKDPEFIAEQTGKNIFDVRNALKTISSNAFNPTSLDRTIDNGERTTMLDLIPDENDYDIDLILALNDALKVIPDDLKKILHMKFVQDMTQTEIGEIYGVSQVHIGRKIKKALNMLREVLQDG